MTIVKFARILLNTGETCGATRQDFEAELQKRAEADQRPGETIAQAYVRLLTKSDEGRLLFQAAKLAPSGDAVQDLTPRRDAPAPAGPASKELTSLAMREKLRRENANVLAGVARTKGASFESSYAHVMVQPENRDLAVKVKAEELRIARENAESRSPISSAQRAFSR